MKLILFRLFSIVAFLVISSSLKGTSLDDLRAKYMTALYDQNKVEEVYHFFLEIEEPSAKILAYRGALEAIMTKTTWNIFKKIGYLNKSEASFKEAIRKSPNDIEIRFMRLAVQYEIPEYLGFSNEKEEDRSFIVANISRFDASNFSMPVLEVIHGFMIKSNYFTKEQILNVKRYLALR